MIELIGSKTRMNATFLKRRKRLFKKAKELEVMCGVYVELLVVASDGKRYPYTSANQGGASSSTFVAPPAPNDVDARDAEPFHNEPIQGGNPLPAEDIIPLQDQSRSLSLKAGGPEIETTVICSDQKVPPELSICCTGVAADVLPKVAAPVVSADPKVPPDPANDHTVDVVELPYVPPKVTRPVVCTDLMVLPMPSICCTDDAVEVLDVPQKVAASVICNDPKVWPEPTTDHIVDAAGLPNMLPKVSAPVVCADPKVLPELSICSIGDAVEVSDVLPKVAAPVVFTRPKVSLEPVAAKTGIVDSCDLNNLETVRLTAMQASKQLGEIGSFQLEEYLELYDILNDEPDQLQKLSCLPHEYRKPWLLRLLKVRKKQKKIL